MADEKTVFDKLDDLTEGQETILSEIRGANSHFASADSRIEQLEKEIRDLKNNQRAPVEAQPQPIDDRQIIRQYVLKAKKSWRWFGSSADFKKVKKLTIISILSLLGIGLINTIVSAICFQIYSTFTFIENIWMIFIIVDLVHIISNKQINEIHDLQQHSHQKFFKDEIGMLYPYREKIPWIVFRILAIASAVCNLICIWTIGKAAQLPSTIFEILYIIVIFFVFFVNRAYFNKYSIIWLDGNNLTTGAKVVMVVPPGAKAMMPEEDFKQKFPFFYE